MQLIMYNNVFWRIMRLKKIVAWGKWIGRRERDNEIDEGVLALFIKIYRNLGVNY